MNPSSQEISTEMRKLLERLNEENYDSVVHQLSQAPQNLIQHEVFSAVLPNLLKDASASGLVLDLWHVNPLFFARAVNTALNLNPEDMNIVVDLFQKIEILLPVLDLVPVSLGIRLAALASQKNFIDMKDWLSTNLTTYEDMFFEECLSFLKEVESEVAEPSDRPTKKSGEIWDLYKEAVPTFSKVLQVHSSLVSSSQLSKKMETLCITSMHNIPTMENVRDPDSSTFEGHGDQIETEVNAYFQQMFSGQLTVGAMVEMLTRFKGSSEKREHLVFECMINNILEVNKFFNKYPYEQVNFVAVLFGLLIKHHLISDFTLDIALKAVMDALREPTDSIMFIFGTKALENFVGRLIEWPEYSQKVLQISHLRGSHLDLVSIIEQTLGRTASVHPESDETQNPGTDQERRSIPPANVEIRGSSFPFAGPDSAHLDSQVCSPIQLQQKTESHLDDKHKASGQVSVATSGGSVRIQKPQSVLIRSSALNASSPEFRPPSRAVTSARFGSALGPGTLLAATKRRTTSIEAPSSDIQAKISFIVNNLSDANIEAKAKEFTEFLEEKYYPWFARYLVIKRASIEPNFHMLYINFLEKASPKLLMEEIIRETYENCKVLLKSELIESSVEERSLLKNLGAWLGKITIGRNKVLLCKQIDPKSLILEAYEKGLMIGIIPFISKVLEPCKDSLAYQPPNPWTMGILGLLAEIYAMPNLKANLQFAIEISFKRLDVDMKTVTPTSLLKDRVRKVDGNLDFSNKDVRLSQQPLVEEANSTSRSAELPHEASGPSYQGGDSCILYQHAAPLHFMAVSSGENEMENLGFPNQFPLANGPLIARLPIEVPAPVLDIPEHQPFLLNMHFERVLPMVMDMAIKELLSTFVEKSISIAIQTTMELVLKEFVTNSDESYIYSASCSMVVCLAGNLSYVACKGPLRSMMSTHLRNSLQGVNIESEFLECAMQRVIDDNLELGCETIEKAASEKGLIIVKKEVAHQLSIIKRHKEGGNVVLEVQQQSFLQPSSSNLFTRNNIEYVLTTGAALDEYQSISKKIEFFIDRNAHESEIQSVVAEVPMVILRCNNKDEAALAVAQMVFESLFENASSSAHVNAHVAILSAICHVSKIVGEELTGWVILSDDNWKFNKDITVTLIHRELLNLNEYDVHMANLIDAGKNGAAMEFCISLVQTLEADDASALSTLHNIVAALGKATTHPVANWVDDCALQSSEPDPPGFHWEVSLLFADWFRIRNQRGENDAARAHYVVKLHQNMLSKADDTPDRFFRHFLELAVSHCLSSEETNQETDISPFIVIDIYTDLVCSILKFCPDDQGSNKLSLFSKVLAVIVRFIRKDAEEKKTSFSSKPYLRLFINLFLHFDTLDLAIDDANFQVLAALSSSFHALQPLKVPAFSFSWVELISHKDFMPKLFAANGRKGWSYFKRLMLDLLQFLEPFLTSGELTEPVLVLYKGTLRVLLVLVHDFPDFICYYHFNFCEVIAPRCVQLRNIILSTFPPNMRLPSPHAPNLKVDLLVEMSQSPSIDSDFDATLRAHNMKSDVDEYLSMKPELSSFLFELNHKFLLSSREAETYGTSYNVPLMNSFVLYVGTKAIQQLQASTIPHETSRARFITRSAFLANASLDIFWTLILDLNSEGRYLFFNAVADQLRYPNNHTHYFSFVMLYYFSHIKQEEIQAQITRVLLERLITRLPHPWGVQVTFLELVKNPVYKFWELEFTRCDPEIKRVFDSVSTTLGIDVGDSQV